MVILVSIEEPTSEGRHDDVVRKSRVGRDCQTLERVIPVRVVGFARDP